MASWVLNCPDCKKEFTHSKIPESNSSTLDPFTGSAVKPGFPVGGFSGICPNCKATSIYQRYELTYRGS